MMRVACAWILVLCAALVAGDPNVIDIQKQLRVRDLKAREFHAFNTAHLIFNNGAEPEVTTADFKAPKVKTFHALSYTGEISIGNPGQKLTVAIETAISDVMIFSSKRCKFPKNIFSIFCWSHKGYNEQKSSRDADSPHWEGQQPPAFQLYPTKSLTLGHLVFDNIKIGQQTYKKTVVGVIDSWSGYYPYGKADGVLGTGRFPDSNWIYEDKRVSSDNANDIAAIQNYPVWSNILAQNGASQIGFHLYKDKTGRDVGQLVLGADQDTTQRYKGDLHWIPEPAGFKSIYYRLTVTEMRIAGSADGSVEEIKPQYSEQFLCQADPGTSLIAGPPDVIKQINTLLVRGWSDSDRTMNSQTVQFDCRHRDRLPNVVFVIAGKEYTLEPKDYVIKLKDTCVSGFLAVPKLSYMVLGDTFLQKYYIIYDGEKHQMGLAEAVAPIINK